MNDKKEKLSLLTLTIFMIISIITPVIAIAEPDSGGIQLVVDGGFDGVARLGAYSPIHVKISNVNRNINAEVQVEASLDASRKILFAKPVELTSGGDMDVYFEVPVVSAKRVITVRVVEKKKNLAEEKYSFKRLLPPETVLIGVLSEDPDFYRWLNGYAVPFVESSISDEKIRLMMAAGQAVQSVPIPGKDGVYNLKQAVMVSFDRNSFPDNSEVLDAFNYLIISKYDTGLLNETQVNTIEKWVDSGGVLMLGTGVSWQKVYNGLPDSLKPFKIENIVDYDATEALAAFTGFSSLKTTLKTARGNLGFEYMPLVTSQTSYHTKDPVRFLENDIVAGNEQNPLVLKYRKGLGNILVFTFEPTLEPFVSYQFRTHFIENVFRHTNINSNLFYEYRQDYYIKQNYSNINFQTLVTNVPSDKEPSFLLIFVGLLIYVIIIGPVLYLILKKADRRDWAWAIIPMLSVIFLGGMYVFGFKSRYTSAVTNTISVIEAQAGTNEAVITSFVGVFNNKRGTMKMEYGYNSGIKLPFLKSDNRYYGTETDGLIVGKYTTGDNITYEHYNVMLWTPLLLNAEKTIQFDGDLLKDVYFKDNSLKGTIINTSQYDLLDAVIIAGRNKIPIGNIIAGDTLQFDIPLEDNEEIYKGVQEYLDGEFGRTYYTRPANYPPNYREMMRVRELFQRYINSMQWSETKFFLLARNEQIIDFGLKVNNKKPDEYCHNIICVESDIIFQPGSIVEIPKGIIQANFYQSGDDVGWLDSENSIRVNRTGEMEFRFLLPDMLDYTELSISTGSYIPLYVNYNISDNPGQIEIIKNKYEYYLYNTKTRLWDPISESVTISEDVESYIGYGNEVLMKISVVEIGKPDHSGQIRNYERELLAMPEISVRGVAK